jgi:hypothetical protein
VGKWVGAVGLLDFEDGAGMKPCFCVGSFSGLKATAPSEKRTADSLQE